jgi:hypothetical protein
MVRSEAADFGAKNSGMSSSCAPMLSNAAPLVMQFIPLVA